MNNQMIELIKDACKEQNKFSAIENIYALYDQLQYAENLDEMANNLYDWLNEKYEIKDSNFYLFDMENDKKTPILQKGTDFTLDNGLSFYFIINTHTHVNAIISFSANSQEHYENVNKDYKFIEAAFFQISPILQNGIIKKYHIESSSIDSVTNVYNRKYLVERIQKVISLSDNENKDSIIFMMVGIDHFKAVIEEFDHDVGDKVLVELAKVIHSNINDFDIVARLTGDEFLVALVNLPYSITAEEIATNIINQFAQIKLVVNKQTNQTLQKTVCIGISSFPQDSDNINTVLKNADSFLYEAKNKGRGQLSVYSEDELSSIDLF
jgi:diguanylate cyclase (GGDEF)-like protein